MTDTPLPTREALFAAIPARCFKPSALLSLGYLVFDVVLIVALYAVLARVTWLPGVIALEFLIGTLLWSLFVLGHEAGHGAFSRSQALNMLVGHVCHGVILVPWRSWQRSHAMHHMNTGHKDREEVFRAATPEEDRFVRKVIFRSGIFLVIGWPMYLLGFRNLTTYDPVKGSHFTLVSDLFARHQRASYVSSLFVVVLCAGAYASFGVAFGWDAFVKYLLAPYAVFAAWLTFVTYMHHVSPEVPVHPEGEWDAIKGALSTVDRDYGVFNWWTHRIGDHHVIHHLFPTIPHYRLKEATEAVRPLLGDAYLRSKRFVLRDFARTMLYCHVVSPDGSVMRWRSEYIGLRPRRARPAAMAEQGAD